MNEEDNDKAPILTVREPESITALPSTRVFQDELPVDRAETRRQLALAIQSWLLRSPSRATRENYAADLKQFLEFLGVPPESLADLLLVRPDAVAAWRDWLAENGLANSSIRRKLTVLRSLFSYLQTYGYLGANPAHQAFVAAPSVPRDGKTVGLSPADCRLLLDAPDAETPVGLRDRALVAVLAFSACRVGEVTRLRLKDFVSHSGHKVLAVRGKGGRERRVALHPEAVERLEAWLTIAAVDSEADAPLFRPPNSSRGGGRDGFKRGGLSIRAVEYLVERYVKQLGLDRAVTVHSFRVTALTTARERGADVIDLQDFAGHADPRTTLTYIRNRDRLAKSPAYILKY